MCNIINTKVNNHSFSLRPSEVTTNITAWMDVYFAAYSDRSPTDNKLHLPCSLTKRAIWLDMREDLNVVDKSYAFSTFIRVWNTTYSHVIIPAFLRYILLNMFLPLTENTFILGKCVDCFALKEALSKAFSQVDTRNIRRQIKEHLDIQMEGIYISFIISRLTYVGRRKYYKHNQKAVSSPNDYVSLIGDGADQSMHVIPFSAQKVGR
eukprot:Pompholyxophrys_sp_v1_NODE_14_length_4454_cov_9.910455.p2 type:complete len:208 gc:universal NODE_14_length_4454_cov_9.910455:825-202(-)